MPIFNKTKTADCSIKVYWTFSIWVAIWNKHLGGATLPFTILLDEVMSHKSSHKLRPYTTLQDEGEADEQPHILGPTYYASITLSMIGIKHLWKIVVNDWYTLIEQSLYNRTTVFYNLLLIHSNKTVFIKIVCYM